MRLKTTVAEVAPGALPNPTPFILNRQIMLMNLGRNKYRDRNPVGQIWRWKRFVG